MNICSAPPPHTRTWISIRCAFFWSIGSFLICVCAMTRIAQQCFFSCSSSASMPFLPSVYFLAYLEKHFFLALDLEAGGKAKIGHGHRMAVVWGTTVGHHSDVCMEVIRHCLPDP